MEWEWDTIAKEGSTEREGRRGAPARPVGELRSHLWPITPLPQNSLFHLFFNQLGSRDWWRNPQNCLVTVHWRISHPVLLLRPIENLCACFSGRRDVCLMEWSRGP